MIDLSDLPAPDHHNRIRAETHQAKLTKPRFSLGKLEKIAAFMASWGNPNPRLDRTPRIDRARAAIFAGNHGVAALGVSAFPASVTAQMVANFEAGGAAINQLAGWAGLELVVVPLDLDRPTADFTQAPAMTADECRAALAAGAAVIEPGIDLLVVGEMGIGNSTSAAALAAASYGGGGADWVGPGTGVAGEVLARKSTVVDAGLALHAPEIVDRDPFEILRRLGGRELAAIAGAVLAARRARVPVILDGFIATAAIAPLVAAEWRFTQHCLAGHVSTEPGHQKLLDAMRLKPILSLGMRLGEGSGAALAAGIVRAALAVHHGMATFEQAGVSQA